MTFAEQLKEIMKKDDLTQKEVAATCHICKSTVSEYVNEKKTPSYETAERILRDLGYELGAVEPNKVGTHNEVDEKHDLRKNGSGYSDPTAYKAIRRVDKDRERLMKLLDVIFGVCELAGFHVEERIVLKDKKTGKIWR